jgi:hypothetical protein
LKIKTFFRSSYVELNINSTLNSRLIPAHMQGQQTVAASAVGSSSSSTIVNASATGVSTTATTNINEKPITPTNRSDNTPPPSVAAPAATTTVNGPGESDAMNSLDDQTTTSGDSINKDRA